MNLKNFWFWLIKERDVDNGEIGGFLIIWGASQWMFSFIGYVSSFGLFYKFVLSTYISLTTTIIIGIPLTAIWLLLHKIYIYRSMQKSGNKWSYDASPLKPQFENLNKRFENLNNQLNEIEKLIKEK